MTIRKAALPLVLPYRDNGQIEQTFIRSRCNLGRARQGCGTCNGTLDKLDALAGMPQHENERARAERLFRTREHAVRRRPWVETFSLTGRFDTATGERCHGQKEAKKLDELFHDTLKDIYFAEKKILATLPKMEKGGARTGSQRAFAKHKTETEGHVTRLEKVFAAIDKKPQAKTCDASSASLTRAPRS